MNMFAKFIQNMAERADISIDPRYKSDLCSVIKLTKEKQIKTEAVRIRAVGTRFGLTIIAKLRSGRNPAPVTPPKRISFVNRSRFDPCRPARLKMR